MLDARHGDQREGPATALAVGAGERVDVGVLVLAALLACLSLALPAEVELDARRMCFIESGFNVRDCRAQLFVIEKRARARGVTWLDAAWSYSALKSTGARAREVKGYPAGDVPGWNARLNHKWAVLGVEVSAYFAGERRDPFPRAEHWRGRADPIKAGEIVVGVEANSFVRFRRAQP